MIMYGLDLLGVAKFANIAKEAFPAGWALGCFSNTFGDARPAVDWILRTGRCPRVRVHLLWHDNHRFTASDIPEAAKEARKWRDLMRKHPLIEWHMSGACEHDMGPTLAAKMRDAVLEVLPKATYVNTPMQRYSLSDCITETHAIENLKGAYNFSFDGKSAVDSDVTKIKAALSDAETFFFWVPQFNLRRSVNDNTPRPQRTVRPTEELIRSVAFLATDRGAVKLPSRWLLKSHAEDTGSSRSNKPCFIIPIKTSRVTLKSQGRIIAKAPYFGPYSDGRYRYYCSDYGYQIAMRTEFPIEVWVSGKKYGTCSPAFRQGGFRE